MPKYIPNETIKISHKDPPWMTWKLKTAIKQKHRVYRKFIKRGRKEVDWDAVWVFQIGNIWKIAKAKTQYFTKLRKMPIRACWEQISSFW